jgi:hypothetical protein
MKYLKQGARGGVTNLVDGLGISWHLLPNMIYCVLSRMLYILNVMWRQLFRLPLLLSSILYIMFHYIYYIKNQLIIMYLIRLQIGESSRKLLHKSKFIYVSYEVVLTLSSTSAEFQKTWSYISSPPIRLHVVVE